MEDRIFGGLGILLAAFYIYFATQIELSFISDPVGPKTFPIIIGVMLGLSGLVIALRPDPSPVWPPLARLFEIAAAVAVMVLYAYALPQVGFLIATAVASAYLGWRLGARPLAALASGVATSTGIYVVFHLILGLSLAKGPLGI